MMSRGATDEELNSADMYGGVFIGSPYANMRKWRTFNKG